MSDQTKLPFCWFMFRVGPSASLYGSFSRDEAEAIADIGQRIQRPRRGSKKTPPELPTLTRDTEAEARANEAFNSHAKVSSPASVFAD